MAHTEFCIENAMHSAYENIVERGEDPTTEAMRREALGSLNNGECCTCNH